MTRSPNSTTESPTYPTEFFDTIFDALPDAPKILEVGPGTGQATQALLARGAHVTAVELGPHLAAHLSAKHAAGSLIVVNDDFETAELPLRHFDAVVSASAYHWIDPALRASRPHELLVANGLLAVIELTQVASDTDRGYFDRVQPIYEAFGDSRHDWSPPTYDSAIPAIAETIEASPLFQLVDIARVRWDQTYTSAQYHDLVMTYSPTRAMAPEQRDELVRQLVTVVEAEFDGAVTRPLVAILTIGRALS